MLNKKVPPYKGILAEEIPTHVHQPMMTQEQYETFLSKLVEQKIAALFDHYQIDKNKAGAAEDMFLQLAMNHIKGFQFMKHPRKWMAGDGILLFLDVIAKAKRRDWNFSWACQQLVKTEKYKGEKARTLYTRFMEQRSLNPTIAKWFDTDDIIEKRRICDIIEKTADELYNEEKK